MEQVPTLPKIGFGVSRISRKLEYLKTPHPKNKLNKLVLGLPDVRAEDEFDAIEVERCRLENDLDELLPLLGSL